MLKHVIRDGAKKKMNDGENGVFCSERKIGESKESRMKDLWSELKENG